MHALALDGHLLLDAGIADDLAPIDEAVGVAVQADGDRVRFGALIGFFASQRARVATVAARQVHQDAP